MVRASLKVYGWTTFASYEGVSRQVRAIVAAPSVAEVLRVTGMTRSEFGYDGEETGNAVEIEKATSAPGVVFYAPVLVRPEEAVWVRLDGEVGAEVSVADDRRGAGSSPEPDVDGLGAARRYAGWHLGDPSWANLIIAAYLDPDAAHSRLDAGGVPPSTGTYRSNMS